jgi:hypothetical protein
MIEGVYMILTWIFVNRKSKSDKKEPHVWRHRYDSDTSSKHIAWTHPAGESAVGWSCIVSSPNLLKAAPAAVKISPT